MAGRVTFLRDGWEPPESGWAKPLSIPKGALDRMALALNRELSPDEIKCIEKELGYYLHLKDVIFAEPTRQDVKRTLASINRLSPCEAEDAYLKCDETTRALIEESLLDLNLYDARNGVYLSGATIKQAAAEALHKIKDHKGGRPSKIYRILLCDYSVRLWIDMGGSSLKAWSRAEMVLREESASPIVTFFCALVSVVDEENLDPSNAVKLLHICIS